MEKLLPLWGQEVGIDDALELLGPGFTDGRVKAFAVRRLQRADDEVSLTCDSADVQELQLYLLQLVQALKFEHALDDSRVERRGLLDDREDSGLSQFLIDRAVVNPVLGTALHWYLMIECDSRMAVGKMYAKVAFRFMKQLSEVSPRPGVAQIRP